MLTAFPPALPDSIHPILPSAAHIHVDSLDLCLTVLVWWVTQHKVPRARASLCFWNLWGMRGYSLCYFLLSAWVCAWRLASPSLPNKLQASFRGLKPDRQSISIEVSPCVVDEVSENDERSDVSCLVCTYVHTVVVHECIVDKIPAAIGDVHTQKKNSYCVLAARESINPSYTYSYTPRKCEIHFLKATTPRPRHHMMMRYVDKKEGQRTWRCY